jgi:hypothetical protein
MVAHHLVATVAHLAALPSEAAKREGCAACDCCPDYEPLHH